MKYKSQLAKVLLAAFTLITFSCNQSQRTEEPAIKENTVDANKLPSWNDGNEIIYVQPGAKRKVISMQP